MNHLLIAAIEPASETSETVQIPLWQFLLPTLGAVLAAGLVAWASLRVARLHGQQRLQELAEQRKADAQQRQEEREEDRKRSVDERVFQEWKRAQSDAADTLSELMSLRYDALRTIFRPSEERIQLVLEQGRQARRRLTLYVTNNLSTLITATANETTVALELLLSALEDMGAGIQTAEQAKAALVAYKEKTDELLNRIIGDVNQRAPAPLTRNDD